MDEFDQVKAKAESGEWLTSAEGSILLKVSLATFHNRVRDGSIGWIPKAPGSKNRLYSPSDVLRLVANAKVVRFNGSAEA